MERDIQAAMQRRRSRSRTSSATTDKTGDPA
jgi:hypothetical protein